MLLIKIFTFLIGALIIFSFTYRVKGGSPLNFYLPLYVYFGLWLLYVINKSVRISSKDDRKAERKMAFIIITTAIVIPIFHWAVTGKEYFIYHASRHGHTVILRACLIQATPDDLNLALAGAAEGGEHSYIKYLLARGADVNTRTLIAPPLTLAAGSGSKPSVETLLKSGASVNAQERMSGRTALMISVERNDFDVVQTLLVAGADVSVKNKYGKDAIQIAEEQQNPEMKNLLRQQARPTS